MMIECYKTESLGNDFILFDWLELNSDEIQQKLADKTWPIFVKEICRRHYGIGSDGVLIVIKKENHYESLMFNVDGTQAEKCLNGIRCTANYLKQTKNFKAGFKVYMHNQYIPCSVTDTGLVTISITNVNYIKELHLGGQLNLSGHAIDAGNPHFVILKEITLDYLHKHGSTIENDPLFPNRTNVEFIWEEMTPPANVSMRQYHMLVHERGSGITLACGSGGAAVIKTLHHLQQINTNEEIVIKMAGGNLNSSIDPHSTITQKAHAKIVSKILLPKTA